VFISRQFIQLPGIAVNEKDSWKLCNDLLLKVHGIVKCHSAVSFYYLYQYYT